jgi:hypothetical protein
MGTLIAFPHVPRVFTPRFCEQLAIANRALRQLRDMGVAIISCDVSENHADIVINKNPHRNVDDCPGVRVSHNFGRRN